VLAGPETLLGHAREPELNELDRIEAAALRDAVVQAGGRAGLAGGALCVGHESLPVTELNRAIPAGPQIDLDAIAAWYGGQSHGICVPPGHEPLDGELAARGYRPGWAWMKFERGDQAPPAVSSKVAVAETDDPELFGRIVALGSDIPLGAAPLLGAIVSAPGWHCFLGSVASGALFVDGRSGWLGVACTLPEARGRGAQSALLRARLELGRTLGVTTFATETGERLPDRPATSYRNILRAGFREAYRRPNWSSPT
jgi:GNAT superfamily N-acetyltransferase